MATYFSILAWRIPRTEEPGRLLSMGSQGVGHDSATKQQQSIKISNYYAVNLKLIYCKSTILQLKNKIKPLGRPHRILELNRLNLENHDNIPEYMSVSFISTCWPFFRVFYEEETLEKIYSKRDSPQSHYKQEN